MIASVPFVFALLLLQVSPVGPRGSIGGRVISAETGEGLRAARVFLSGEIQNQRLARSSVTADDGAFSFDRLPAGTYSLAIHKYGYRPAAAPARVSLQSNQLRAGVELKMHRPGVVTGAVTDPEGLPVAGAQVTAFRITWVEGRRRADVAGKARADDRGRYRIFGLEAGRYVIGAAAGEEPAPDGEVGVRLRAYYPAAPHFLDAAPLRVGWGQEAADINLVLRAQSTFTVSGRVMDRATAGPCTSCLISARRADEPAEPEGPSSRVAADGGYRLQGLIPGPYRIMVEKTTPPQTGAAHFIQVTNRNLRDIDLAAGIERAVAGRVVFESPPGELDRAKMEMKLLLIEDGGEEERARLAPDLSFEIRGLAGASYRVILEGMPTGGYLKTLRMAGRELPGPVIEPPDSGILSPLDVVVAFDAAALSGRVKSEPPGSSARATIVLFPQQNESPYLVERRVEANGDNRFLLAGLAPGSYTAFALPPDGGPDIADPEVRRRFQNYGRSLALGPGEKTAVELELVAGLEEP